MPDTVQRFLPRWSIPEYALEPGSRDALGFQRYAGYFADRLLPNITVLTSRARYYSFVAWVLDEITRMYEPRVAAGETLSFAEFTSLVSRFERWLALGEAVCHTPGARQTPDEHPGCSWIGMRKARALAGHGRSKLPLDVPLTVRGGSSLANYRESMYRLGLITGQPDLLPETLSDIGHALADAFRRAVRIARADRIGDICFDIDTHAISTTDLERDAPAACLSQISEAERDILTPLLLRGPHAPLVAELSESLRRDLKRPNLPLPDAERLILHRYLTTSAPKGTAFDLAQVGLYQAFAVGCLTAFNGLLAALPETGESLTLEELVARQIRHEHQSVARPLHELRGRRLDGHSPINEFEDACRYDALGRPTVWLAPALRLILWVIDRVHERPTLAVSGIDSVRIEDVAALLARNGRRLDGAAVQLCVQLVQDHLRVFASKRKRPWVVLNGTHLCTQESRLEPGVRFPPNSVRLNAFVSLWRDLEVAA